MTQTLKYLINAHGITDNIYAILPQNVRIIMLCNKEAYMCNNNRDTALYAKSLTSFEDDQEILNLLNSYEVQNESGKGFCAYYKLNDNNEYYYPDIVLKAENTQFDSGIYELPILLNRIILNPYKIGEEYYEKGDIIPVNEFSINIINQIQTSTQQQTINNIFKQNKYILLPNSRKFHSVEKFFDKYDVSLYDYQHNDYLVRLSSIVNFLTSINPSAYITLIVASCTTNNNESINKKRKDQEFVVNLGKNNKYINPRNTVPIIAIPPNQNQQFYRNMYYSKWQQGGLYKKKYVKYNNKNKKTNAEK
jgi:hypothetical protein